MKQKVIAGIPIDFSDDDHFVNPDQWTREIAGAIAMSEGLVLDLKHFEILEFLRERYFTGHSLTVKAVGNSGLTTIKEFYELFPGAPMKVAARLAGIPKPKGCF